MKSILPAAAAVLLLLNGCTSHPTTHDDSIETSRDTIREHGTTGLGAGSDTTTQTGIDTGTRSGSGLP